MVEVVKQVINMHNAKKKPVINAKNISYCLLDKLSSPSVELCQDKSYYKNQHLKSTELETPHMLICQLCAHFI